MEKKVLLSSEKPTAKEVKSMLIPGKPLEKASQELIKAMEEASGKIAYTAIRTVYQKEATSYMLKLLYDASLSFARANNQLYKEAISSEKGFSHDEEEKPRKKQKVTFGSMEKAPAYDPNSPYSERQVQLLSFDEEKLYEMTIEAISSGEDNSSLLACLFLDKWEEENREEETEEQEKPVSFFVPVRPKKTVKTSEKGKLYDIETKYEQASPNNEFQDVKQECFLAIWEVYASGLINDASDIWIYSKYYYSKIRALIRSNKKVFEQNNRYVAITSGSDKDGGYYEKLLTDKQAEKALAKIDSNAVLEAMEEYLIANLDKRSKKEAIASCFRLMFLGYTQERIGEKLGVNQKMVSKYKMQIKRVFSSSDAMELVHDLVTG